MAKRKPATIGKILVEEFMKPIGLTQGALAEAMGLQRKHVNKLCNDRRNVTAASALILARVFGNSADFCSMCSSAAICGERCTRRVNANGLSARDP